MNLANQRLLRDEMRPFLVQRDAIAYFAALVDFCCYLSATALAVVVEPVWQKALLAVVAGTMISTLFVLAHDAAHGGLLSKRWQNRILGRILFFPALHNYSLWLIQHNRLHHQSPNVKGLNSWAPLTPIEYQILPRWRKFVERFYRGGGFGVYYLIERWWKDKFIPFGEEDPKLRGTAWLDFAFLVIWFVALLSTLIWLSRVAGQGSASSAIIWGFLVPYAVWNSNMGLTTYLQHTHPAVPWFRTEQDAQSYGGQEELTINVKYPRWYGLLSHDIMEHPAHHINPRIPFYRLHAAQTRLIEILGRDAVVERIGLRYVRSLVRRCKLYDYERREWLDFAGRTTGQTQAASIVWRRPLHGQASAYTDRSSAIAPRSRSG
jgi:acyl-lipid omega-6 desaturase (Delta-12 desaturase)